MAITVLTNSPLSGTTGTYAVNNSTYDPRLYFTHTSATLYYMVFERILGVDYLRETGKLSGYNNSTNYSYKFDFDKFITFDNQIEYSDFTVSGTTGTLLLNGNSNRVISFSYSTGSTLYSANVAANKLLVASNGDVTIATGTTITGLTQEGYTSHIFQDTIDTSTVYAILPTDLRAVRLTYFPVVVKAGYKVRYTQTPDTGTAVITTLPAASTTTYNYYLNMIYILPTTKTLKVEVLNSISGPYYSYTVSTVCGLNAYYYWNNSSMMDVVYLDGTKNIVDTVVKENILLKNKSIFTKINKTKKISQHTGFNLSDAVVRELINAPIIYGIEDAKLKSYTLDNDNFTGFNGVSLSGRDIELMLTDNKSYERKTNNSLTFFD